jgi:hypothetical protein
MSTKIQAVTVLSDKARKMRGAMKELRRSMGPWPSYHAVREAVIELCIAGGIGEVDDILYLVKQLRIDRQDALDTLRQYEGSDPLLSRWKRDEAGCYRLHVQRALLQARPEPTPDEF